MGKFWRRKMEMRAGALVLAAAMVFSFCLPLSAFADGEESGGPALLSLTGGGSSGAAIPGGGDESGDGDPQDVTVGASRLLEELDPDVSVGVRLAAEPSVKVGEKFELSVTPSFKSWTSYNGYPGVVGSRDILSALEGYSVAVELPAGIEYCGAPQGIDPDKIDVDANGGSTTLTVTWGDFDKSNMPPSASFSFKLRMKDNGSVANGASFPIRAALNGTMRFVTAYNGDTPEATVDIALEELPDWGYQRPEDSVSVLAGASESWDVAKTPVGEARLSGDAVTFQFKTAAGLEQNGVILSDPNAAGAYDSPGRLFFEDFADGKNFAVGESMELVFYVYGENGTREEKEIPSDKLLPPDSVAIRYQKLDGALTTPPGDSTLTTVAPDGKTSFFTSRYYNLYSPNAAGGGANYVGESPAYTAYSVVFAYSLEKIAQMAEAAGVTGAAEFTVRSRSGLRYQLIGETETVKGPREAEQSYAIGAKSGTIEIHQYLYSSTGASGVPVPYGPENPSGQTGDPQFILYRKLAADEPSAEGIVTDADGSRWLPVRDAAGKDIAPERREIASKFSVDGKETEVREYIFRYEAGLETGKTYRVVQKKNLEGYVEARPVSPEGGVVTVSNREVSTVVFTARPLARQNLQIHKAVRMTDASGAPVDADQTPNGLQFAAYRYQDDEQAALQSVKAAQTANYQSGTKPPEGSGWYFAATGAAGLPGVAQFSLPEGNYFIIELKNEGYALNKAVYAATVANTGVSDLTVYQDAEGNRGSGEVIGTQAKPVVNTPDTGSIEAWKEFREFRNYGERFGQFPASNPETLSATFEVWREKDGKKELVLKDGAPLTVTNDWEHPFIEGQYSYSRVRVDNLPEGIYYLKERNARENGYTVYQNDGSLAVDGYVGPFEVKAGAVAGNAKKYKIHNLPDLNGHIFIRKLGLTKGAASIGWSDQNAIKASEDAGNAAGLSGAAFTVKDAAGNPVKFRRASVDGYYIRDAGGNEEVLTGGGGLLLLTGLDVGAAYALTETAPPQGYEIPEGTAAPSITLTAQGYSKNFGATCGDTGNGATGTLYKGNVQARLLNVKTGALTITKESDISGQKVRGAAFEVYVREGEQYVPLTATDKDGVSHPVLADNPYSDNLKFYYTAGKRIDFTGFSAGVDYYLYETKTPNGFVSPDNLTQAEKDALIAGKKAVSADIKSDRSGDELLLGPFHLGVNATVQNKRGVRAAFILEKKAPFQQNGYLPGVEFSVQYKGQSIPGAYYTSAYSGSAPAANEMKAFTGKLISQNGPTYVEIVIPGDLFGGGKTPKAGDVIQLTLKEDGRIQPSFWKDHDPAKQTKTVYATVFDDQHLFARTGPDSATPNVVEFVNGHSNTLEVYKYRSAVVPPNAARPAVTEEKKFTVYCLPDYLVQNGVIPKDKKIDDWSNDGIQGWFRRYLNTDRNGFARNNDLPPDCHYFIEETNPGEELFAGVNGKKVDGGAWNGAEMTTITVGGNEHKVYDITALFDGADGNKKATLYAFNVPTSGGTITIHKTGMTSPSAAIPDADLKEANFDLYAIMDDSLTDEAAMRLSADALKAAGEELQKIEPKGTVCKNGYVTFNGVANPRAGKADGPTRYLVVETRPPLGHVLEESVYADAAGQNGAENLLRNTRAVVEINFNAGETTNGRFTMLSQGGVQDGEGVPTLCNAPEKDLNIAEAKLGVRFTAPLSGAGKAEIADPLEEMADGTDIEFVVTNQSTLQEEGKNPNMVPLRDFGVALDGLVFYDASASAPEEVGDRELKRLENPLYEITRVVVPFASDSGSSEIAPALFVGEQEITNRQETQYEGRRAYAFTLPGGTKTFRALYGEEKDGYRAVGTNFQAPAIAVTARVKAPASVADGRQIRAIDAEASVSFEFQISAFGDTRARSAKNKARIPVCKSVGFPKVEVLKGQQLLRHDTANGTFVPVELNSTLAAGDAVDYTITLNNSSDRYAFRQPVVIDKLPAQLDFVKGSVQIDGAPSGDPVVKIGKTQEGFAQSYLVFEPGEEVAPGASVKIQFRAMVGERSSYMSRNVTNVAYATSAAPRVPTKLNPTGITFRDKSDNVPAVDDSLNNSCPLFTDDRQPYPTVSAQVTFGLSSSTAASIKQFIRGEYELSGDTALKDGTQTALTTSDGRVEYWIMFSNQTTAPLKDVRLLNALPVSSVKSAWHPTLAAYGGQLSADYSGGSAITGMKTYYKTGGGQMTDKEIYGYLEQKDAAARWNGWSDDPGTTESRTLRTLTGKTEKVDAYPEVSALGFQFEGQLQPGETLTIHIRTIAPTWTNGERVGEIAVNRAAYGIANSVGIAEAGIAQSSNDVSVTTLPLVSVGDKVWLDKDRDGIQNDGEDSGIGGVKVTLSKLTDGAVQGVESYNGGKGTGPDGSYMFGNLSPWLESGAHASYRLEFEKPSGAVEAAKTGSGSVTEDSDGVETREFRFLYTPGKADIQTQVLVGGEWRNHQTLQMTNGAYKDDSFDCGYVLSRELSLLKIDELTKAPLQGAQFELRGASGSPVTSAESGEDGLVRFVSASQNPINYFSAYTAVETLAPAGYALDTGKAVNFAAGVLEAPYTLQSMENAAQAVQPGEGETVTNLPAALPLEIVKTVAGDNRTKDHFTFTLYEASLNEQNSVYAPGSELETATLDGAGTVRFKAQVTPGKYYAVRETVQNGDTGYTGERYTLSLASISGAEPLTEADADGYSYFRVMPGAAVSGGTVRLSAVNTERRDGSLSITKMLLEGQEPIDAENDTFTFTAYPVVGNGADGKPQIDQSAGIVSDAIRVSETYTFTGLPLGRYALIESGMSSAAYQFVRWGDGDAATTVGSNAYLIVTVAGTGSGAYFTAVNTVRDGSLAIAKTITGGVRPAERGLRFTFDIYRAQKSGESYAIGDHVAATMVSPGTAGSQTVGDLTPGLYAVREQDYSGYTFNSFSGDGETVTIDGIVYFIVEVQGGRTDPVSVTAQNDRDTPPPPPEGPNDPGEPDEPFGPDNPGREWPTFETAGETDNLVTIDDEQIPLAQNPLVTIPDEPIPLAGLPAAGGMTPGQLIPLGLLLAVAGFWLAHRKRGPNK